MEHNAADGVDLMERARAHISNDASGWDDPNCRELGCGYMAESEPADNSKIRGNYTHDDTQDKPDQKAADHGYKLVATISMASESNAATEAVFVEKPPGARGVKIWLTASNGVIPATR